MGLLIYCGTVSPAQTGKSTSCALSAALQRPALTSSPFRFSTVQVCCFVLKQRSSQVGPVTHLPVGLVLSGFLSLGSIARSKEISPCAHRRCSKPSIMAPTTTRRVLAHAALLTTVASIPAPTAFSNTVEQAAPPMITPSPVERDPTRVVGRNILSDVESDADSVLSGLGSNLPSWVASGVPNFFQGFPTGEAVVSSLGLNDEQLDAVPTNVLNIDPYANWTESGWSVRFHGNVYKQPNTSVSELNKLADIFLVNTSISDLPEAEQDQARNLTAEIFVVQQPHVAVDTIHLEPAESQGSSGQPGGGGSSNTTGGTQDITLPYNTTVEGDFDTFVPIKSNGLTAGNETSEIQRLNTFVEGASIGNGTAYLVPPTGLTVISDIDDILRVTKIYQPEQGLLNSFARAFTPWENMPDIYRNWSTSLPDLHFHYLVSLP